MADYEYLRIEHEGTVATVKLARPEVRNAMNVGLIREIQRSMQELAEEDGVRVVVLTGEGDYFCAGADIKYMRDTANFSYEENRQDARELAAMFRAVEECPKPVVVRVGGAAIGGGVGLVAAADVAVAEEGTVFAFSEVRLGISPATIAPFVLRKIGYSQARALFLTGERFDATKACEIGLVHQVADEGCLDEAVQEKIEGLLAGGPEALSATKALLREIRDAAPGEVTEITARRIAGLRTGEEGQEGLAAFLEKRETRLEGRHVSFGKLLISNRGEIAVRIIRACKELEIETVAVYSEADEGAMHVRLADEAYLLGPAPATGSYLNLGRISEVIEESGTEAVHPGYGFLSENAWFARMVEEAGAIWVGPPAEAMEKVGDKIRAKELARNADVPTVSGYAGEDESEERLAEEAGEIGYPVLVKASAGGGGRGMRPVHRPEDFVEALQSAKREAESAFGEGSVFLEKLVENPRHVEVQVIADHHGNVVHLYERECSIQRRHQKVVEEAPSPALNPKVRKEMCAAAVRLTREAGYRNAGTVEFLLSGEEEEFYFLEMNARLQVEHPVTELVTGQDLVHLQLAVAAGEPLPISQEDIFPRGSAIETRVYTEEEGTGLPAGGKLRLFAPSEGSGIRNDTGVASGDEVSLHYDPMISKLIVFAADRKKAILRLRRALDDYTVLGVPTNLPLLRRIVDHPSFEAGETTTEFLEEHGLTEVPPTPSPSEEAILLAAAVDLSQTLTRRRGDPFSGGLWRLGGALRLRYKAGEEEYMVEVGRSGGDALALRLDGREATVEVLSVNNGAIQARLDGRRVAGSFALDGADILVSLGGEGYRLSKPTPPDVDDLGAVGSGSGGASLTAPMPGAVVKVLVNEGDEVEEGQLLLVLEAMKTEHSVAAPRGGVVGSLPYNEGDSAPGGAVLVELEEEKQ